VCRQFPNKHNKKESKMTEGDQETTRKSCEHDPELVIAYLWYALEDVRSLSERGMRHLEDAIRALSEDTRVVAIPSASEGHRFS